MPFPPFPTTDEVPHLQVVEALGVGATGDVYRAELQHPNRPDLSSYAIKIVGPEWQSSQDDRNRYEDLHNEYVNYCLLQLGKRDHKLKDIINHATTPCYGLYQTRNCSWAAFALITAYAGTIVPEGFPISDSKKYVDYLFFHRKYRYSHNLQMCSTTVFDISSFDWS